MKLVSRDREWSFEYERFRLSPQPAYYFEEPQGYKKACRRLCRKDEGRETMASELIMHRRSCCWNYWPQLRLPCSICGVERASCCWLPGSSVPKDVQEAFDKQQYEQVLKQLAKLEKEQGVAPDVRRLKIRSFLKPG